MREIKFRGKTDEMNSWWTYGSLVICDNGDYQIGNCSKYGCPYYRNKVFEDTVGQYTGLKDKNGKEIYEGDIVYVASEDENAFILWDEETARYIIQFEGWCADFDNYYGKEPEVIGNIYDNPDLLEKEEEE